MSLGKVLIQVLIVGSNGYLGSQLRTNLGRDGRFEVHTLSRSGVEGSSILKFDEGLDSEVTASIYDSELFRESSFDFVVNCAASTLRDSSPSSVGSLVDANVLLPSLLGSHLSDGSARLIHVGTYSHKSDEASLDPQTFYAGTKFAGELLAEWFVNVGLRLTTLHVYDIYGPGQPHNRLIPKIIETLKCREPMEMTPGAQEFRPLFVEDLIAVITEMLLAPGHDGKETFDVYGPDLLRVKEMPKVVSTALDLPFNDSLFPMTRPYAPREIMLFNPCHPLPNKDKPWTTIEEGLKRVF